MKFVTSPANKQTFREAREKLGRVRPTSLGQASRISGICPADLAVVLLYLGQDGQSGEINVDGEAS